MKSYLFVYVENGLGNMDYNSYKNTIIDADNMKEALGKFKWTESNTKILNIIELKG